MRTYEKIETIFQRDINGTKRLIPDKFRNETVEFLRAFPWIWTEKVDGTNIRIVWDGYSVRIAGRSDSAQIPADLVAWFNDHFVSKSCEELFEQLFGEKTVILFGEGYGRKIQKGGGLYIPDGVNFILFDVLIGENYQSRETVEEIAKAFGIDIVPIVGIGTLDMAVEYVKSHQLSIVAQGKREMEGVVCRPRIELRDRCGNRVIVKIKWEDFKYLTDEQTN